MKKSVLLICAFALMLVVTLPNVHASVNYGFFILGGTVVGACSGKCENLRLTTSTADTSASVKDAKTVANFPVDPGVGSSTTTATEGASPSGFAWVYDIDLAGVQIQSGTWTFHVKTTATSATGTAFIHLQVFTCLTHSLGTCTKKITVDDAATNIQATTTATVRTYTATSVAAFNANFLAVEYWVDQTVASGSTTETITITTVATSTSDVQTPQWNEPLAQSITVASANTHPASHPRSLTQTVTDASALTEKISFARAFAQTVTAASSLAKVTGHFYSLAQSITGSGGLDRLVHYLDSFAQSITIASSQTKVANHFASLVQSVTGDSSLARLTNYFDSLAQSIAGDSGVTKIANHFYSLAQFVTIDSLLHAGRSFEESLSSDVSSLSLQSTGYFNSLPGSITGATDNAQGYGYGRFPSESFNGNATLIGTCEIGINCPNANLPEVIAFLFIVIGALGFVIWDQSRPKRK